jgi:hypothetical protein
MAQLPRLAVWSLMAGGLLAGCTPPPAPIAAAPPKPAGVQLAQQAGGPDVSPEGLQTFMFGPPPRTRVDPYVRCLVKCPPGQAGGGQKGAAVR